MLEELVKSRVVAQIEEAAKRYDLEYLPWEVANAYLLARLSEQLSALESLVRHNSINTSVDLVAFGDMLERTRKMLSASDGTENVELRHLREDQHTGMMLALMLDPVTARQLALPGGEPAEELHCTLCYLGDMEETPIDGLLRPHISSYQILDAISTVARESLPLSGTIGGIGRFMPAETDEAPMVALVDVPGLVELRTKLVQAIKEAGYWVAENHGFTAHITLAYIDPTAAMPLQSIEALPLSFDTVWLCIGDQRVPFKLGVPGEANTTPTQDGKASNDGTAATHQEASGDSTGAEDVEAGQGSGASEETRTGAQWVIERARQYPECHIAIMGRTAAHARDVMVKGILGTSPHDFTPEYMPSRRLLIWPNGSRATIHSIEELDQLCGLECSFAWADKQAAQHNEAWNQLSSRLRISPAPGVNPWCIVTREQEESIATPGLGDGIEWTDADLDELSRITSTDLKAAVQVWNDNAPDEARGLLNAEKVEEQ